MLLNLHAFSGLWHHGRVARTDSYCLYDSLRAIRSRVWCSGVISSGVRSGEDVERQVTRAASQRLLAPDEYVGGRKSLWPNCINLEFGAFVPTTWFCLAGLNRSTDRSILTPSKYDCHFLLGRRSAQSQVWSGK